MLKKHMAACLVVTAFAAAPVLAQTSTTPSGATDRPAASGSGSTTTGSPAMQPGASGGAGSSTMGQPSTAMGQSGGMQGQFMTKMETSQMMASDLIGTRVVSANNESIGDINDVIVDRNGQIMAAVVGVGGFLGIGEKDVAVPFKSLEFVTSQQAQAMDSSNSAGNTNVATTGSTATTGNTATTGSGAAGSTNMAANNANNANASSNQNQPERVMLRMTKAELQAAPAFNEDGNNSTTGSAGAGGQPGTTTAPKQ